MSKEDLEPPQPTRSDGHSRRDFVKGSATVAAAGAAIAGGAMAVGASSAEAADTGTIKLKDVVARHVDPPLYSLR